MKSRLNLTIDDKLLEEAKVYAASKQTSLSELFENYLRTLSRPAKRKSVLDILEKLEKPRVEGNIDLKDQYYKDRAEKYGF